MATMISAAAQSATSMASNTHHGLSHGQIAGIVVGSVIGGLLLIALFGLGLYLLWRRQRKPKGDDVDVVNEKNYSIDSSPAEISGRRDDAEMTKLAPNEDPTKYMSQDGDRQHMATVNKAAIITPAHEAGIRTAADVKQLPGHVTANTMKTARNIGDLPVNRSAHALDTEAKEVPASTCNHYNAVSP